MENYLVTKEVVAGSIRTNFKELKEKIDLEMAGLKEHLTNIDNLKDTKEDLANLRKFKNEMADHKKSIISMYDEPVKAFKDEFDLLMKSVEEAEKNLADGIKAIEEQEQNRRLQEAFRIMDEIVSKETDDVRTFFYGINGYANTEKWKNKTFWDRKDAVRLDVEERLKKAKTALQLFINHKHSAQLLDSFQRTFDLDGCVAYMKQIDEAERKAEELRAMRNEHNEEQKPAKNPAPQAEPEKIVGVNLLMKGTQSQISAVIAYIEKLGIEYINKPIR